MVGSPYSSWWPSPWKKITAPFQVGIKHKPLQVRTGLYVPLPDQCWNIDWVDGACLVQVTKPALSSWLQWPCHGQKTLTFSSPLWPQSLRNLLTLLPVHWALVVMWKVLGGRQDVTDGTSQSLIHSLRWTSSESHGNILKIKIKNKTVVSFSTKN